MINNNFERDFFQDVIQTLTFSYSIRLPLLCSYEDFKTFGKLQANVSDNGNGGTPKIHLINYYAEFNEVDYVRTFKRCSTILKYLCTENFCKVKDIEKKAAMLVGKPKVYDEFILDSQVSLYNESAVSIGFNPIDKMFNSSVIKHVAYLDGKSPSYRDIVKYFPYYSNGERNGFNFIEFIIMINIFQTLFNNSLSLLNKPICTQKDEKTAKKMVEKLCHKIDSDDMFEVYVYALFDIIFFDIIDEQHFQASKEYIRKVWLPEELKNRKDVFRAYAKRCKELGINPNETNGDVDVSELTQIDSVYENGSYWEITTMEHSIEKYLTIDRIYGALIDALEILILKPAETEKTGKDNLSHEYASIITRYIEKAKSEAKAILRKTYEEEISPLKR